MRRVLAPCLLLALAALEAVLLSACGSGSAASTSGIRVVAAENFWGSIASQLTAGKGSVQSIITNPAQDPHSYQPTAADARTLAGAQLVIVNGLDYDSWANQLLAANPVPGRIVVNVGDVLGLKAPANPHRWYDPANVEMVAAAITSALQKLDAHHAAQLAVAQRHFETTDLATYHRTIAAIKARYAGVPVGASESIFALLAPALGLKLLTPSSFMDAIAEGTDVSAQDVLTTQHQITAHQIKVWVYNSQNATPAIQRLNQLGQSHGIPVVTITETLSPASDSFEQWQVAQLQRLEQALHRATGR